MTSFIVYLRQQATKCGLGWSAAWVKPEDKTIALAYQLMNGDFTHSDVR